MKRGARELQAPVTELLAPVRLCQSLEQAQALEPVRAWQRPQLAERGRLSLAAQFFQQPEHRAARQRAVQPLQLRPRPTPEPAEQAISSSSPPAPSCSSAIPFQVGP